MTGLSAVLALALVMAACDTTTDPGSQSPLDGDQTRLTILLTDAPGDIAEAWVQITGIYLQGSEGDEDGNGNGQGDNADNGNGNGNGDDQNGGRVWLMQGSADWVNLIALADTWMTLVDVELPAGVYSQLRFIVGGAVLAIEGESEGTIAKLYASSAEDLEALNSQLENDDIEETVPFEGSADGVVHCPSCSQTGFKVRFPGGAVVLEAPDNALLVDFDVSETFGHRAGNSGRWIMHPTLLGSVVEGDDGNAGYGGGGSDNYGS
jgi:hypothetical protein